MELENDYKRENELISDADSVLKNSENEKNNIINNQSDLSIKIKSTKEDLDFSIVEFNTTRKNMKLKQQFCSFFSQKNNLETNLEENQKSLKQLEEKITKVKNDKSKVSLRKKHIENELISIRNELEIFTKDVDKKSIMLDKTDDEVQTLELIY